MPDYSVIQRLCGALRVTLPELMDGADAAGDSDRSGDTEQILDLLRRTQELERQRRGLCGLRLSSASRAAPYRARPGARRCRTSPRAS